MNRIVLIGNGFDLAHGLKTRYQDFINWYWEQRMYALLKDGFTISEDPLCTIKTNTMHPTALSYLLQQIFNYRKDITPPVFWSTLREDYHDSIIINDSPLMERINKSIETKKWVDIENEYYYLLKCYAVDAQMSEEIRCKEIIDLNLQLKYLQELLVKYLSSIHVDNTIINSTILERLKEPIRFKDISVSWLAEKYEFVCTKDNDGFLFDWEDDEEDAEHTLILCFNYTETATLYLQAAKSFGINFIHGHLSKPDDVIFGYGDELDKDFKDLKERSGNVFLNHVKSIRYLESDNYRQVLQFIDSAPFQIYIMGHSCGNSDRTLLNTLFEHKNCISIKPFYYTWLEKDDNGNEQMKDNYLELVQNISRNFTDMKLMRDRVVNKTYCKEITK